MVNQLFLKERVAQALPVDPVRGRFPLEIKHRVHRRDLHPALAPLHGLLYDLRVVPRHHAVLSLS